MGLIHREQLESLLACPRCRSPIRPASDGYACSSADCALSRESSFPLAGEQPVLVDFEDSILSRDEVLERGGRSIIERDRSPPATRAVLMALLPSNKIAADNAERLRSLALSRSERPILLVVGGGSPGAGTDALYDDPLLQLIGFDIYGSPLTQFIGDAHRIPLGDSSVDAVWIQAVLEHVLDPWAVVAEIHRILKPGGLVYAETPFMQQAHEGACDFTRFTESGHRWLFRNFEMIDAGVALGPAIQFLWSTDYLVRGLFRSVKAGVVAKLLLFWVQHLDRFVGRGFAIDGASAVFFLGTRSDHELRPRDMIDHYKGAHKRA